MSEQATFETVREIALALPGVTEGTSHDNTPAFYVGKKFMSRLWKDGDTLVMRVEQPEQEMLAQADPDIYFFTDHYAGYPYILIRLSKIHPEDVRTHIERAWRLLALKRMIKEYEGRS
jgi:hypothetical protein